MDRITAELDELVRKAINQKKKRCTAKAATNLLIQSYKNERNVKNVANRLFNEFHYEISGAFFLDCSLTDEEAESFVTELICIPLGKEFKKTDRYNYAFYICSAFSRKRKHWRQACRVLFKTLKVGEDNVFFDESMVELYKKLDDNKSIKIDLKKLIESAKKEEIGLLNRFGEVIGSSSNSSPKENPILSPNTQPVMPTTGSSVKLKKDEYTDFGAIITKSIEVAFATENRRLNDTISTLKSTLAVKEQELASVTEKSQHQENRILALETEVLNHKERADTAFKMDTVGKEQAITTLKSDISGALKLEYDDFKESIDSECNTDNYEASRASLQRIFKILRRYNINME